MRRLEDLTGQGAATNALAVLLLGPVWVLYLLWRNRDRISLRKYG